MLAADIEVLLESGEAEKEAFPEKENFVTTSDERCLLDEFELL